MADLHKYTSKEVLNKVLLDSSGNSVAAFSHTSAEALNAALDATNSRLNVSLAGGTITGDVTITGDLTVNSGTSSLVFDESVVGDMSIKGADGGTLYLQTSHDTIAANDVLGQIHFQAPDDTGADSDLIGATIQALATATFSDTVNSTDLIFKTGDSEVAVERMRIDSTGTVTISHAIDPLLVLNKTGGSNAAIHFQHDGVAKGYFFVNADQTINLGTATKNPALTISPSGNTTFDGVVDIINTTDATDATGDTGALKTEGGLSVAKTIYSGLGVKSSGATSGDVDNNIDNAHATGRARLILRNAADLSQNMILSSDANNSQSQIAVTTGTAKYINFKATEIDFIFASASVLTLDANSNVFPSTGPGTGNTIFGNQAGHTLPGDEDGNYNSAFGQQALYSNNDSYKNVALGYAALYFHSITQSSANAGFNTSVGAESAFNVNTSTNSTFVGGQAGFGNSGAKTTGSNNTAVGYQSGYLIQGASHSNTFVGASSGNTTTTGVENTIVGFNCEAEDGAATNQVVIGNNLNGTKDNAVFIGNDSSHIENDFNSDATWNHSSDRRQKKDIKDDSLGLSFINDLRTVTYKHKSPSEFPQEWDAYNPDDKEPMGGDKVIHGFIAQEVKEALDKAGVDTFQGWNGGSDGRQRVSFEAFVMPLIRSVQELSAKVDELEKKCNCK